jgi:hypothetical protein
MLPLDNVPEVGNTETLSRFILFSRHIRSSDETIRAEAFVPHPREELSVNRDLKATDQETWNVGRMVARKRSRTLYGRGDTLAATYISQQLTATAAPLDDNPNHVNICKWPTGKPEQLLKAKDIAEKSKLLKPDTGNTQE